MLRCLEVYPHWFLKPFFSVFFRFCIRFEFHLPVRMFLLIFLKLFIFRGSHLAVCILVNMWKDPAVAALLLFPLFFSPVLAFRFLRKSVEAKNQCNNRSNNCFIHVNPLFGFSAEIFPIWSSQNRNQCFHCLRDLTHHPDSEKFKDPHLNPTIPSNSPVEIR